MYIKYFNNRKKIKLMCEINTAGATRFLEGIFVKALFSTEDYSTVLANYLQTSFLLSPL